jgi:hypothetical protein
MSMYVGERSEIVSMNCTVYPARVYVTQQRVYAAMYRAIQKRLVLGALLHTW